MNSARPAIRFVAGAFVAASSALALSTTTAAAQDTTAAIHYKGITLTPVGFAAAEAVYRQRNLTADIGSSYGAIPFNNTSAAKLSEFRATGRQSRIGFLMEGQNPTSGTKYSGFWEADFLGVGTTSNSNESDSYALRIRQYFGQITTKSGWSFDGGQMWSLATPDKSGVLPRAEHVPLTIEAQYAVGFDWARQPGFRISKKSDATSFALALEGAQTTFSARNANTNILIGQAGGSQLNGTTNYSTDLAPDLVAKIAFDPKGMGHWELKAIGRLLRDRIVDPTDTAGGSRNITSQGGGIGFGVFFPVMSGNRDVVDIGLSGMGGVGIGRYGTTQLSDATIGSDRALKPIKGAHLLLSIEAHPTPMLDVYGYGGTEYADRTTYLTTAGKGVGYGSPLNNNAGCETEAVPTGPFAPASGACAADTRNFLQGNLGFWYRFYKGASGTVQWGMQYSYTKKDAWIGTGGEPVGTDNMIFTSLRYVLP
ncbi:MAG TPA: hypothetical protein VGM82_19435 [Gemmatimonadaceae bacterium]|jgi:hypothetical protein